VDGAQVHVHVEGTGPDVILIHGAGGNWQDWTLSLIPALRGEFRFYAVDRPAHGYSSRLPDRGAPRTPSSSAKAMAARWRWPMR